MRRVRGVVTIPADAPTTTARVVVEVRDVSYADGAAPVLASVAIEDTPVRPGGRIPFVLDAPEVPATTALSLRCHLDIVGDGVVAVGDLLSTRSIPVPVTGDAGPLTVPVDVVT
ncbi:Uncharacterised protein [Rhodococcus gordoniae]|uniref:Lipoprotein n=1 Tax=Rhodococcus gordoniae TaxID=223392 RepID=A0A379LTP3_9NOCA|nr:YbaY family lipoprotein [Rhodococcus gordoniae]SUE13282.1 Uncharacterised protein [Rhodococcus gordoniae]